MNLTTLSNLIAITTVIPNYTLNTTVASFPEIPFGRFIGISVGVFCAIGILINAVVLLVVLLAQQSRFTAYKYLMCHLACADLMCSIMLGPYVPLELAQHNWIYKSQSLCKIIYPLISCFTNIATGTILLISLERFRGIMYPYRSAWSRKDICIAFSIVWVVSVLLILPNVLTIRVTSYKNIDYCNEIWVNDTYRKIYGMSYFALAFAIPLVLIAGMHIMIMIRLKSREINPDNTSTWQEKQNTRIMRVLSGIIVVFFISTCPNKILYFVWDVFPELELSHSSQARHHMRTVQVLYYSRVAMNPLVYCFFDTRFKDDLKKALLIIKTMNFDADLQRRSRTVSQRASTTLTNSRANSVCEIGKNQMKPPMTMESIAEINITCINKQVAPAQAPTNVTIYSPVVSQSDSNSDDDGSATLDEKRVRSDTVATDLSSQHESSSPLVLQNLANGACSNIAYESDNV